MTESLSATYPMVSFRASRELDLRLRETATARRVSKSRLIKSLVEQALDHQPAEIPNPSA
jgi:predicted transcriptional regulator